MITTFTTVTIYWAVVCSTHGASKLLTHPAFTTTPWKNKCFHLHVQLGKWRYSELKSRGPGHSACERGWPPTPQPVPRPLCPVVTSNNKLLSLLSCFTSPLGDRIMLLKQLHQTISWHGRDKTDCRWGINFIRFTGLWPQAWGWGGGRGCGMPTEQWRSSLRGRL